MSQQDEFDRIIAALHAAALDAAVWPRASALIDEAVGMAGSHLVVASGHTREDAEFLFGDRYDHGEFSDVGLEYVDITSRCSGASGGLAGVNHGIISAQLCNRRSERIQHYGRLSWDKQ